MALFTRQARPVFGALTPQHGRSASDLHATAFAHGWSDIEFERLLAAGSSHAEAAFDAKTGALIGFILSRAAGDEAEVLTIVVAQRWRRQGLGRDLLDRHVASLANSRVRALYLEVNTDNTAARALYARAGFAEAGRRKAYYPGASGSAPRDALVLRRAID